LMPKSRRRGFSTTSRRCAVDAASSRSSTVRCACRARHCCLRGAELCAAVRAAGPFAPLSSSQPTILGFIHTFFRAPQAHVQFVRFGRRGEKRGREARVMGHTCDPRRISSSYGIACSSRCTNGGSSASYVRFICFVVYAVQKIVCAEPIGHLHFHH
jgi:hypothetical protein